MQVKILKESGYPEALLGMSLSYYDHETDLDVWWDDSKCTRAKDRAGKLAHKDGGHNKFLESIQLWVYVQASRDFWQEMDTYRSGVTKQSASTMHTLDKRAVTSADFEEGTSPTIIDAFNICLTEYKDPNHVYYKNITRLKKNLPEGWLQERVICLNYKSLRHIYAQREKHRLKDWQQFCKEILEQIEHKEFIIESS